MTDEIKEERTMLELKNVTYTYESKYQKVQALRGVDCTFEGGRVFAVIGKSGSGKTTMLSLIAGLDLPTGGEVLFEGRATGSMRLDDYRRQHVAMIYQSFRLFPLMTAMENVMYPMEMRKVPGAEARKRATALIARVGLPENVLHRYPAMLSGGEQQRVAIARALAMDTRLLLADEPTGNLDTASSETVVRILRDLAHEEGYCVIIVTHDPAILTYADEVYRMTDGVLRREAAAEGASSGVV